MRMNKSATSGQPYVLKKATTAVFKTNHFLMQLAIEQFPSQPGLQSLPPPFAPAMSNERRARATAQAPRQLESPAANCRWRDLAGGARTTGA